MKRTGVQYKWGWGANKASVTNRAGGVRTNRGGVQIGLGYNGGCGTDGVRLGLGILVSVPSMKSNL